MKGIGLSTYAYLWHMSERADRPYRIADVLHSAKDFGVGIVQICDVPELDAADDDDLATIRRTADQLDLALEVGTRGIEPERLERFLRIAQRLEAATVRTMLRIPSYAPTVEESIDVLRAHAPHYDAAGVGLSIETYEQVRTQDLVDIVEAVASPALGICSDPSNTIAILEKPAEVMELIAPYVNNMHIKDYSFRRRDDGVGFELIGTPLGTGLLQYEEMIAQCRPAERGVTQIIEQWLPWQGDIDRTLAVEDEWNSAAVAFLRIRAEESV